jgi:5-methylcytosine-specific restriction endonuclease McrA
VTGLRRCYVCKDEKPSDEICPNKKCKSCMAEYRKSWYEANKAVVKARQDAYRAANLPHLRAKDKDWRQNNVERDRARTSKWAKDNPERRSESQQRRRARKAGSQVVRVTTVMLRERLRVFDGLCAYCRGPFEHWDHVKPLELGGPHILANLRPSCARCNGSKGSMPAMRWLRSVRNRVLI